MPTAAGSPNAPPFEPIPLAALVHLPSLMLPQLSWQRDQLAFYWDRTGRNELYLRKLGNGDVRQVSRGNVSRSVRSGPIWSRSGDALVVTKDVEGDERYDLYRIEIATGEMSRLTHIGTDLHAWEFSPDDRWILFVANAPGRRGRSQSNAWRVPAEGGTPEQLTDFDSPVGFSGAITYSPDGRFLAFSANESTDLKNADLYVCGSGGEDPHRVFRASEGSRDSVSAWHPDSRHIAFDSDASGLARPLVLDLSTQEARPYGSGVGDEYASRFSPNGRWLLTNQLNGVRMAPCIYDLETGEGHSLAIDEGVTSAVDFAADGDSVVCQHTNSVRRFEFVLARLGDSVVVLQPADYGELDPSRLVKSRVIRYPTFDGREVEALLYSPKSIPPGVTLPAIVEVHGGPTGAFLDQFQPLAQHLASRGFVLLQPNIRGSVGYGAEFRDLNRLDWGGGDLEDVVRGAEYLADLPTVDSARIGIWGGSYGGYMTYLATVRRPELWKAACAWVGISDLERLYDESREHYQYYFRQQMGDPKTHRTLWRERSAVHFAERLRARLLMVHGVNDPRCPVDQARIFRDRLLELGRQEGVDFEYTELTDEGHGSSDMDQRLRSYSVVSEFFGRAL